MGHFSQAIRADPSNPSNYFQLRHALFLDDRRAETAAISLDILHKFPHLCNTMTFHFDTAMSLYGAHRRKVTRFAISWPTTHHRPKPLTPEP